MTGAVIVLLALAYALGYTAGRIRPYREAAHVALSKTVGWRETSHLTAWALAWCALSPRMAFHSWRHRNDPKPEPVRLAFMDEKGST